MRLRELSNGIPLLTSDFPSPSIPRPNSQNSQAIFFCLFMNELQSRERSVQMMEGQKKKSKRERRQESKEDNEEDSTREKHRTEKTEGRETEREKRGTERYNDVEEEAQKERHRGANHTAPSTLRPRRRRRQRLAELLTKRSRHDVTTRGRSGRLLVP